MKSIIKEIAEVLANGSSAEFIDDNGKARCFYSLYLNEDGSINPEGTIHNTDDELHLTAERDISEYAEDESPERVYDTETLEDESFRAVCEELAEKIEEARARIAE